MRLNTGAGPMELKLDCRHYRGDRPCARGCEGQCEHDEPMGHRILLIKLAALGDVIRTEALLAGLKSVYPQSHITWVTRIHGCRMLANNPLIDRLLEFSAESMMHLQYEQFDMVISLDKEPAPAALAMRVQSPDKRGIGLSPFGTLYPLNPEAHRYFALGLSDRLKFQENHSSYQRLIYEAVGLTYSGERYSLYPARENDEYAAALFQRAGVQSGQDIIGLNTGAGSVFANKTWPPEKFAELAAKLIAKGDCRVALLGGPDEEERNKWIARRVGPALIHAGCQHRELDFAALVHRCTAVLSGDTTAMHVAIALRVPVVVLFGPTCPQEIDLYGRGYKLISKIQCAPCYKRHCDYSPNCMDLISVLQAEEALGRYLRRSPAPAPGAARPTEQIPSPLCAPTGERVV